MNMTSNKEVQNFFNDLLSFNTKEEKVEKEKNRLHFKFVSGIERIMQEKKMSKKDLAKEVNTSASYITQLFRGNKVVNLEILAKIKEALDIQYEIHIVSEKLGERLVPFMIYQKRNELTRAKELSLFNNSKCETLIA